MSVDKNYSEILKMNFVKNEDGSLIFEDGVSYSVNEINSIKLINKNSSKKEEFIRKIHLCKKAGLNLGIVLKNVY